MTVWFVFRSWGSSLTIELPLYWVNGDFVGFTVCAVVAFERHFKDTSFQLICNYHFKNKDGDCQDLNCEFDGWYGWKNRRFYESDHLFIGYDPCLDATKNDNFGKFSEVLIKFYAEDMDNNLLHCCDVIGCGVRPLYMQEEKYVELAATGYIDVIPRRKRSGGRKRGRHGWLSRSSMNVPTVEANHRMPDRDLCMRRFMYVNDFTPHDGQNINEARPKAAKRRLRY